ncbi:Hypothetical protein MVR_LOCUS312 [uncultured virus]|nr:Hypothetical protein MVR_LOCUS312 [uncultured virus]
MPARTPQELITIDRIAVKITAPKRSHAQVKKQARRGKFDKVRKLSLAMRDLDAINEKHKVGNLTFASCKYSKRTGTVSYVEHSTAHGNMGAGIIMIRASVVNHSERVYDLIEIAQAKAERDAKKKEAETVKAIEEMERLRQQEEGSQTDLDVAIDADILAQHTELVAELDGAITDATPAEPSTEPSTDPNTEPQLVDELDGKLIENPDDDDNTDMPTDEDVTEPMSVATAKAQKRRQRMKKKVDRYKKDLAAREEKKGNNRLCRNYLADLKAKNGFKLTEDLDIQYFEVLVNSTSMVIEDAKMYTLALPSEAKETILIIVGDLAMKSAVIRRIDPAYKVDKVFKEQTEFLDRIRARDDTQTIEVDTIDDLADSDTDSMDGRDIEEFDIREMGLVDDCPLLEPITTASLLDPASN